MLANSPENGNGNDIPYWMTVLQDQLSKRNALEFLPFTPISTANDPALLLSNHQNGNVNASDAVVKDLTSERDALREENAQLSSAIRRMERQLLDLLLEKKNTDDVLRELERTQEQLQSEADGRRLMRLEVEGLKEEAVMADEINQRLNRENNELKKKIAALESEKGKAVNKKATNSNNNNNNSAETEEGLPIDDLPPSTLHDLSNNDNSTSHANGSMFHSTSDNNSINSSHNYLPCKGRCINSNVTKNGGGGGGGGFKSFFSSLTTGGNNSNSNNNNDSSSNSGGNFAPAIYNAVFSEDGEYVYTVESDRTIKSYATYFSSKEASENTSAQLFSQFFNYRNQSNKKVSFSSSSSVSPLTISSRSRYILTGNEDGSICIGDVNTQRVRHLISNSTSNSAGGGGGGGGGGALSSQNSKVIASCFSSTCSFAFTADKERLIHIWDLSSSVASSSVSNNVMNILCHSAVTDLTVTGEVIYSTHQNGSLCAWDRRTNVYSTSSGGGGNNTSSGGHSGDKSSVEIKNCNLPSSNNNNSNVNSPLTCVKVSECGNYIFTLSKNNTIGIRDTRKATELYKLLNFGGNTTDNSSTNNMYSIPYQTNYSRFGLLEHISKDRLAQYGSRGGGDGGVLRFCCSIGLSTGEILYVSPDMNSTSYSSILNDCVVSVLPSASHTNSSNNNRVNGHQRGMPVYSVASYSNLSAQSKISSHNSNNSGNANMVVSIGEDKRLILWS